MFCVVYFQYSHSHDSEYPLWFSSKSDSRTEELLLVTLLSFLFFFFLFLGNKENVVPLFFLQYSSRETQERLSQLLLLDSFTDRSLRKTFVPDIVGKLFLVLFETSGRMKE